MSFDGSNLLIGDRHGPIAFIERPPQEINLLRPQDAGANFGYPYGTPKYPDMPPGTLPPVIRVAGTSSGIARITGGYVYRGPIAQLNGLYIFGDEINRNIFAVPAANLVQGQTIEQSSLTSLNNLFPSSFAREVRSFALDAGNNLYITSNAAYIVELQ